MKALILRGGIEIRIGEESHRRPKPLSTRNYYFLPQTSTQRFNGRKSKFYQLFGKNTLNGEKLNSLKSGETYRCTYIVQFEKDAYDVRFGMMIKAMSGIELGVLQSSSQGFGSEHVKADDLLKISFESNFTLVPGTYFLNAGCSEKVAGGNIILHRIDDTITLCVLPMRLNKVRTGYFNFEASDPVCVIKSISGRNIS